MSNHMPSKVWDEITYPVSNFSGGAIEVWEWIINFIQHFIMGELINLFIHAEIKVKRGPGNTLTEWVVYHNVKCELICYV